MYEGVEKSTLFFYLKEKMTGLERKILDDYCKENAQRFAWMNISPSDIGEGVCFRSFC